MDVSGVEVQLVLVEEDLLAKVASVSDPVGVHEVLGVAVLLLQLVATVLTLELGIRLHSVAGHVLLPVGNFHLFAADLRKNESIMNN